jgi:hypothetical protein
MPVFSASAYVGAESTGSSHSNPPVLGVAEDCDETNSDIIIVRRLPQQRSIVASASARTANTRAFERGTPQRPGAPEMVRTGAVERRLGVDSYPSPAGAPVAR